MLTWRRSYDIPPPELELDDERHPRFEEKYRNLPLAVLPATESLKITIDRVLPYWFDHICPQIKDGKRVIVVAHGNRYISSYFCSSLVGIFYIIITNIFYILKLIIWFSLRAIVKYLSDMSEEEIIKYNIPTGVPFVYEFDENLNAVKNYYLLDDAELKRRQEEVANQGKA